MQRFGDGRTLKLHLIILLHFGDRMKDPLFIHALISQAIGMLEVVIDFHIFPLGRFICLRYTPFPFHTTTAAVPVLGPVPHLMPPGPA